MPRKIKKPSGYQSGTQPERTEQHLQFFSGGRQIVVGDQVIVQPELRQLPLGGGNAQRQLLLGIGPAPTEPLLQKFQ